MSTVTLENSSPARYGEPSSVLTGCQPRALRCFVYQDATEGDFIAECIDLDLTVKAKKLSRAKKSLEEAVIGYLEVVNQSGDMTGLLPRPSPRSHQIYYHMRFFLNRFLKRSTAEFYAVRPKTA